MVEQSPGPVVELADTHDLGSCAERREGSSPSRPTLEIVSWPVSQAVKALVFHTREQGFESPTGYWKRLNPKGFNTFLKLPPLLGLPRMWGFYLRFLRLVVRTGDSQSSNTGSIPVGTTPNAAAMPMPL